AGLRDVLLAAVPAAVDAAAIVAGSTVALLGRPPGRQGWVGAAVVAVLLGLPHPYLTIFVLQGPHHVATAVVCLVAFGLLGGAGRENLPATPKILGGLLGVGGQGGLRGGALVAHAVGAGLFAAGIAWSAFRSLAGLARRRRSTSAWLDDVLLLGFGGGVALFALLTDPKLQAVNARYLLPPLVFGAVLTARRAIE